MPVTEYLERNARLYPDEVALVELNPDEPDTRRTSWKEFELIQPSRFEPYRREITWSVFDEKANRFANMLIGRGIKKGDKVAILMYNCLEWLPIYFGVLKTGAIAVPFNFRYDAEEILYCAELAEVDMIVFGPAFIGRIETNAERLSKGRLLQGGRSVLAIRPLLWKNDWPTLPLNPINPDNARTFRMWRSQTMISEQFIFHPERPDSRRQFYINTRA